MNLDAEGGQERCGEEQLVAGGRPEETEDPQEILDEIEANAAVEAGVSDDLVYGRLGPPFDRSSPFYLGFVGALGVVSALALAWIVFSAGQVIVLVGLAFFIAVGLDPAVTWLARRFLPRWAAVVVVLAAALGVLAIFLSQAIPVLVTQATQLATEIPYYLRSLNDHKSWLGQLNLKYHVVNRLQNSINTGGSSLAGGALGVGKAVLGAATSGLIVVIVSVYLLSDLPRVKRGLYQLAPRSRRARMVLLTDEILSRVGGYVLGNVLISVISGLLTFGWSLAFGIPYPLLLGLLVALLDLIPIVGSTVGGLIVTLVALTVSVPVAIATVVFYLIYRFLEDYLLTPRIMGRTVEVPGLVTVVATLLGGALLGIVGALVAIPVAAAIKLLLEELAAPRLDRS